MTGFGMMDRTTSICSKMIPSSQQAFSDIHSPPRQSIPWALSLLAQSTDQFIRIRMEIFFILEQDYMTTPS